MTEVEFRFSRLRVIVDLQRNTATLIPWTGQSSWCTLDELDEALRQAKAARAQ